MSLQYDSLAELFDRYDGFLIDQFGVLISGDGPYPGAAETLSRLGRHNKPVLILSNSGKRSDANCKRMVSNGFDRDDFLTVLSSGEVAHEYILHSLGASIPKGGKVIVLIREGDKPPLDGVDLVRTQDAEDADLLLIVSRDPDLEMASYEAKLKRLATRGVPCLCLNPDMVMLTPGGLRSAAGRLAQMYEEFGGDVRWFGKPHSLIYQKALEMLKPVPAERILCIGDSLSHDIAGGKSAGCKTAMVRTGIHATLSDAGLEEMILERDLRPDHFLRHF